jgi:hypothetical protein
LREEGILYPSLSVEFPERKDGTERMKEEKESQMKA